MANVDNLTAVLYGIEDIRLVRIDFRLGETNFVLIFELFNRLNEGTTSSADDQRQ